VRARRLQRLVQGTALRAQAGEVAWLVGPARQALRGAPHRLQVVGGCRAAVWDLLSVLPLLLLLLLLPPLLLLL